MVNMVSASRGRGGWDFEFGVRVQGFEGFVLSVSFTTYLGCAASGPDTMPNVKRSSTTDRPTTYKAVVHTLSPPLNPKP